MATTTLQPNAEGSFINFTPSSGTDNALMVDEGVASHDGATTQNTQTGTSGDNLELDSTPADFSACIDYTIRCVIRQSGRVDDTVNMATRIANGGTSLDANVDTHDISTTTSYTQFDGTTRSNTNNKAAWDGYEVTYQPTRSNSGMADSVTWYITAIEVVLNYTPTDTGAQPYYVRTGGVPGMKIGRPGTLFGRSW